MTGSNADKESWRELANCLNFPTNLFFPALGKNKEVKEAKAICKACKVRRQCLEYAMQHHVRFGIWGGHTEHERREIIAEQKGMIRYGTNW